MCGGVLTLVDHVHLSVGPDQEQTAVPLGLSCGLEAEGEMA